MRGKSIRPEHFEATILKALADYGDAVAEKVDQAEREVSREAVSELKATSPVNAGRYARGWSHKRRKSGAIGAEVVYNRTDYQLTHLLEKPHPVNHGGHYPKHVDHTGKIADIETKYTAKFMEEVEAKL